MEPRGCGESAGLTGRRGGASTGFIYPRMCIVNLKIHTVSTLMKLKFVKSIYI